MSVDDAVLRRVQEETASTWDERHIAFGATSSFCEQKRECFASVMEQFVLRYMT